MWYKPMKRKGAIDPDQASQGLVKKGATSAAKAERSPFVSGQRRMGVFSSRLQRLRRDLASSRAVPWMSQTWKG